MQVILRLLRNEARIVPWLPIAASWAIAIGLAWVAKDRAPDFSDRQLSIRLALTCLALGFSFALDDPARDLKTSRPVPLRRRTVARLLIPATVWFAAALATIGLATLGMAEEPIPFQRLMVEGATMLLTGLAVAAFTAKRWDEKPGRIAATSVLAIFGASWAIPADRSPWQLPREHPRNTAGRFWIGLAIVVLVALIALAWDSTHGKRSPIPSSSR